MPKRQNERHYVQKRRLFISKECLQQSFSLWCTSISEFGHSNKTCLDTVCSTSIVKTMWSQLHISVTVYSPNLLENMTGHLIHHSCESMSACKAVHRSTALLSCDDSSYSGLNCTACWIESAKCPWLQEVKGFDWGWKKKRTTRTKEQGGGEEGDEK